MNEKRHIRTKWSCLDYYDEDAKKYDEKRFLCDCQKILDKTIREVVYGVLKSKKIILDSGTGTGRFAIHFAERGHIVIALDPSKKMIKIAKKRAKKEGVDKNVFFVIGDTEHLPFKDESIDGICSINVLTHFMDREYAIGEFSRVLKKGGLLVFNNPSTFLQVTRSLIEKLGKTSFVDFPYSLKDVKEDFKNSSLKFVEKINFGLIPRFGLHLLLCVLRMKFLKRTLENVEKIPLGLHSIVVGQK